MNTGVRMQQHRLKVLDVRNEKNPVYTDLGAAGETPEETYKMFLDAKNSFEVAKDDIEFMIDHYDENGDLQDSIGVLQTAIEFLTGDEVKSTDYYNNL